MRASGPQLSPYFDKAKERARNKLRIWRRIFIWIHGVETVT